MRRSIHFTNQKPIESTRKAAKFKSDEMNKVNLPGQEHPQEL